MNYLKEAKESGFFVYESHDSSLRNLTKVDGDENTLEAFATRILAEQQAARGEEEEAERGAIDQKFHGIDFTCWRRVLAAAMAGAKAMTNMTLEQEQEVLKYPTSISSIDEACALIKWAGVESTEYTDCAILYKVTFDQLRLIYDMGRQKESKLRAKDAETIALDKEIQSALRMSIINADAEIASLKAERATRIDAANTQANTIRELKERLFKAETERGVMFEEYDKMKAQADTLRGQVAMQHLSAEDRGLVINGLILERERSLQRKKANSESNSDIMADDCVRLIKHFTDLNDTQATAEAFVLEKQVEALDKAASKCQNGYDAAVITKMAQDLRNQAKKMK